MNREDFFIKKVKFLSSKGAVEYSADLVSNTEDGLQIVQRTEKIPTDPHPDFVNALRRFKEPLGKLFGVDSGLTLIDSKEFKATKHQKESALKFFTEMIKEYLVVTAIKLTGSDSDKGCIIIGTYLDQPITTRNVKFSEIWVDSEFDIEELVDNLSEELYQLVYNSKKSQLDLDFGGSSSQELANSFMKIQEENDVTIEMSVK